MAEQRAEGEGGGKESGDSERELMLQRHKQELKDLKGAHCLYHYCL